MTRGKPADRTEAPEVLRHVPIALRVAGAWSWRLIVVGIVAFALGSAFAATSAIVIPVLVALIIAAPLNHAVTAMARVGIPRGVGAFAMVVALFVFLLGLIFAAGSSIVTGRDELVVKVRSGFDQLVAWLADGPLGLETTEIQNYVDRVTTFAVDNAGGIASGALSISGTVGAISAGVVVAAISLFFFLKDGRGMWQWIIRLLPASVRDRIDAAGSAGMKMLDEYTRAQVLVAAIDAVGIGIGAWILVGLQLAIPLTIAVFLFSFLPLIGATLSLITAVLVTLVDGGWVPALIMLGIAITVQWVEGNILYPWLFGRAVELHPLVILLAVGVGTVLAGIPGALLAVPVVGFVYRAIAVVSQGEDDSPARPKLPEVVTQSIPLTARGKRRRRAARNAREQGKV